MKKLMQLNCAVCSKPIWRRVEFGVNGPEVKPGTVFLCRKHIAVMARQGRKR